MMVAFSRRRGFSLAELLVALPISAVIIAAAVGGLSVAISSFEKHGFYAYGRGWDSVERFFAFLEIPVRHCGVGMPENWDSSLFSPTPRPAWAVWGKAAAVGNSVNGAFGATDDWGNALRLVYGIPTGAIVTEAVALDPDESATLSLSESVRDDATLDNTSSASWLLFPGTYAPTRMTANGATSSPTVKSNVSAYVSWGTPVCRFMAAYIYFSNGIVYCNFNDGSGAQPLFRHIDGLLFKLDDGLLTVKATLEDGGTSVEAARTWRVGQ